MMTTRFLPAPGLCWLLVLLLGLPAASTAWGEAAVRSASAAPAAAKPRPVAQLWEEAEAARKEHNDLQASALYLQVQELEPDGAHAAEALWQGAELQKKLALGRKGADWEKIRDLFRRYLNYYPQAPHVAEAYLEVAVAHYRMRYLREALTYAKLFVQRYPHSELVPQARYWQAKVLLEIGRTGEAEKIFQELAAGTDEELQAKGIFGLGDLLAHQGKFREALRLYQRVADKKTTYYLDDPEMLRTLGLTNVKVGNDERGEQQLVLYLNLVTSSPYRAEVLFELGECYRRQGRLPAAQQLYAKALTEGGDDQRVTALAQYRVAKYQDDLRAQGKKGEPAPIDEVVGDQPYRAVIEGYGKEPIAQEARHDLLARLLARKEYPPAYDLAGDTLRAATEELEKKEVEGVLGDILVAQMEGLLAAKKYQEVYDLYTAEFANVRPYSKGRLLYLVGQAMEALSLYDQASVVYYRALKLSFDEADKTDLYYRRARVYLAQNDLAAAERLLKYLRDIYQDDKALGEVAYYSGRLREAQGKREEALAFYQSAAKILTFPEKKGEYAREILRLLLALDRQEETLLALSRFQAEEWLPLSELQTWYGKIADLRRNEKDFSGAIVVYQAALQPGMPQSGELAQSFQLYLGDSWLATGEVEKGMASLQKAAAGEKNRYQQFAAERLNQREINAKISSMKRIFR